MGSVGRIDLDRMHDLTLEEVRSSPLFAHLSDEEILEVIATIKSFSLIMLEYYRKNSERTWNPQ